MCSLISTIPLTPPTTGALKRANQAILAGMKTLSLLMIYLSKAHTRLFLPFGFSPAFHLSAGIMFLL